MLECGVIVRSTVRRRFFGKLSDSAPRKPLGSSSPPPRVSPLRTPAVAATDDARRAPGRAAARTMHGVEGRVNNLNGHPHGLSHWQGARSGLPRLYSTTSKHPIHNQPQRHEQNDEHPESRWPAGVPAHPNLRDRRQARENSRNSKALPRHR